MLMGRIFDRNMFIMMLAIMVGAVIITFFVSDIMSNSEIETITENLASEHSEEISVINTKNEQFTDNFMRSTAVLDSAREYRASGNYNFDLAFLWYQSALSEKNETTMNTYKSRILSNCDEAMDNFTNSKDNFEIANSYYNDTKAYTTNQKYLEVLDIYTNITKSGQKLTALRYNASKYLKQIAEKIEMDETTGLVIYSENVSAIIELFDMTMAAYSEELIIYEELKEEIDEYEFFDEIR